MPNGHGKGVEWLPFNRGALMIGAFDRRPIQAHMRHLFSDITAGATPPKGVPGAVAECFESQAPCDAEVNSGKQF